MYPSTFARLARTGSPGASEIVAPMVTFSFFNPDDPRVWDRATAHTRELRLLYDSQIDFVQGLVSESEGDGGAWSAIKELWDVLFPGREAEEWPEPSYVRANWEWTVVSLMAVVGR